MAKPIMTEVTVTGKQGRGIYYTCRADELDQQLVDQRGADQSRHLTSFLQGCNPVLRKQVECGAVGVAFDRFGQVRLIEGPRA